MGAHQGARTLISWLAVGVAVAAVILAAIGAAAYPSYGVAGFDWAGFVFTAIFLAAPLLGLAAALRSTRRAVVRTTAVLALLLAVALAAMLLGHAFWGHDWIGYPTGEKVLDVLELAPPVVLYLAAFVVDLPSFTGKRPLARA